MKILVTGCAGFIGSHLCKRLLDDGYDVVGVDALTDFYNPDIKRKNMKSFINHKRFLLKQNNILDLELQNEVKEIEILYHLAGQPGVRDSWGNNFNGYVVNNILTTQRLLELMKKSKNIKKFVYASSSSVYGQIDVEKVNEGYRTKPFSPYGVTKLAGEHLTSLYQENFNVPTISLRFFSTYGPSQRPDMAFSRLINSAFQNNPFPLYGDGNQERDYTFVKDIVDGLLRAGTHLTAIGVYNIGGGHVLPLNEIIVFIEELTGKKIILDKRSVQYGDVRRTSADISKIEKTLGYHPQYNIKDGLREQIEYVQKTS